MTEKRNNCYARGRRRRAGLIAIAILAVAMLACLDRGWVYPWWTARSALPARGGGGDFTRYHGRSFTIVRVVDGDTLHIDAPDGRSTTTKVRLLGIDAPEMGGSESAPAYFSRQARDFARRLALDKIVTLYLDERSSTRGKYARLLAYIELPDGTFLNETLLTEGYAYADWRFDHSYYQKYRQLESHARALDKGLWARVSRADLPAWRRRMQGDFSP